MFITDKMIKALDVQVGYEFANALQYIAVANWFDSEDLRLLAKFYLKQSDDERTHAMKIRQFLIDSGAKVLILELGPFVNEFGNATDAAQQAFDTEVRTTKQIHELVALAQSENCPSASQFLQWFVEEQVEEVATAQRNLNIIKKAGSNVFLMEAYLAHTSG